MTTENQLLREAQKNGPDVELCEPMQRMQARVKMLTPDDFDAPELDLSDSHTALFALAEYWKGKHDKLKAALTQPSQPAEGGEADPCPGCRKGIVCRTPKCGRLKLPADHPLRTVPPASQEPCRRPKRSATEWQEIAELEDQAGGVFAAGALASQEQAQQPTGHIKEPYSVAEIKAKIASGDYSAEMLLQHAMLHLAQQPSGGEVVDEIRHLLVETWGFAATPPRGKDNISAALDLLETLTLATPKPEPMTWRDIETAPKDGRTMFVVKAVDVIRHPGAAPYTSDPWCVWQDKDGFSRWPHSFEPTHWMPLPPAPITKGAA